MYENKLRLVEIAAENWASETGLGSVNIGHLIDEGKLEPDNEEGDYKNPLDDSSMRCKVIQIKEENGGYIAEVTEEENSD